MTLTKGDFYPTLTSDAALASMFPVSEPVEKYEGKLQSTGEAKYVDDIPRGESVDAVKNDIIESYERQNIFVFVTCLVKDKKESAVRY